MWTNVHENVNKRFTSEVKRKKEWEREREEECELVGVASSGINKKEENEWRYLFGSLSAQQRNGEKVKGVVMGGSCCALSSNEGEFFLLWRHHIVMEFYSRKKTHTHTTWQ